MLRNCGALIFLIATTASCGQEERAPDVSDRPDNGTVTVDGAELSWVREGEGPVLFLIGSSVTLQVAYSAELRDHFEMVFVNGRHFTPAYAPDSDSLSTLTLSTFADDVEAIRLELGYEEITVVGHSIHGQVALEYADRYPSAVSSVILIGPVPYQFDEFSAEATEIWDRLASPERKALMAVKEETLDSVVALAPPNRRFAVGYAHRSPLYWADPEYDATERMAGLETGPAWGRLVETLPTAAEARSRLERLRVPILLILGKLDFVIPYTAWEGLINGLPNIQYILLEEDSHNPQTESPELVDPILMDWMAGG